jgi:hypothetical protein
MATAVMAVVPLLVHHPCCTVHAAQVFVAAHTSAAGYTFVAEYAFALAIAIMIKWHLHCSCCTGLCSSTYLSRVTFVAEYAFALVAAITMIIMIIVIILLLLSRKWHLHCSCCAGVCSSTHLSRENGCGGVRVCAGHSTLQQGHLHLSHQDHLQPKVQGLQWQI